MTCIRLKEMLPFLTMVTGLEGEKGWLKYHINDFTLLYSLCIHNNTWIKGTIVKYSKGRQERERSVALGPGTPKAFAI